MRVYEWWDTQPSEFYVEAIRDGLNVCASVATLPITAPRAKENEKGKE